MKVTILDLLTGEVGEISGVTEYDLTEGNYSCDCNRDFNNDLPDVGYCHGAKRFLVIAAHTEAGEEPCTKTLAELNEEYWPIPDCPPVPRDYELVEEAKRRIVKLIAETGPVFWPVIHAALQEDYSELHLRKALQNLVAEGALQMQHDWVEEDWEYSLPG
jgi:hypothetical protein